MVIALRLGQRKTNFVRPGRIRTVERNIICRQCFNFTGLIRRSNPRDSGVRQTGGFRRGKSTADPEGCAKHSRSAAGSTIDIHPVGVEDCDLWGFSTFGLVQPMRADDAEVSMTGSGPSPAREGCWLVVRKILPDDVANYQQVALSSGFSASGPATWAAWLAVYAAEIRIIAGRGSAVFGAIQRFRVQIESLLATAGTRRFYFADDACESISGAWVIALAVLLMAGRAAAAAIAAWDSGDLGIRCGSSSY